MEEAVTLLTISDLIRRGRPHTATSSLRLSIPSSSSSRTESNSSQPPRCGNTSTSSSPNPKVLLPLSYPAILTGTLTLPTETLKCPNKSCFQFSDGSATICCDILDFSVCIIGKKVQVIAWNFIPLKLSAGGFLEIIKWRFPDPSSNALSRCSNMVSIPLATSSSSLSNEDKAKARYHVYGPIEAISPVSLVSCSFGANKSNNLRGFIVRIMACECNLCNSRESVAVLLNLGQGQNSHSFTKPLFVYLYGSFSRWHPVITKIVGNVVILSGLKKKLVFTTKEESRLMLVTTGNSVLHLSRLAKKWSPFVRNVMAGRGELGSYTGTVSGIYMQGMAVELDKQVWLLLTDHLLAAPHSLRMGAIVSLRNVHFVNPKFTWTQMLILGSCFQTCITIESFSPLETGFHVISRSQSQLGKFIESLTFTARLWALLVISCLRKKFASSLTEKEILGSEHKEGLAQMFTRTHLPLSAIQARHGLFMEFCNQDPCSCGGEINLSNLKLVAPISAFLHHCEAMWMKELLQLNNNCHTRYEKTQSSLLACGGRSHSQPLRTIFHSEDIGLSLLGSLKVSQSSGRLQLVDATGSIDVIIPDLPSTWQFNSICEVVNYSIIVEGTPDLVDYYGLPGYKSFSCRNIFHCLPWAGQANLTIYLYFHLSHANFKNLPFHSCAGGSYEFKELEDNIFHLIWISHKYPVLKKFQGELAISERSTMFAEAIIVPLDLFLAGKDGPMLPVKVPGDCKNEQLGEYPSGIYEEHLPNKKRKIDKVSRQALVSDLMNDCNYSCSQASAFSSSFNGFAQGKCGNLSYHEIHCLATVKTPNGHSLLRSGKLCFTNCNIKIGTYSKPSAQKVLLEFNTENLFKYQLLQIGNYYIIKHQPEESICCVKNNASVAKVFISSGTHIGSLSFFSGKEVKDNGSSHDCSQDDSSFSHKDVLTRNEIELLLSSMGNSPESCLDVCLHLSADAMAFLEPKLNETKEKHIETSITPVENFNDSAEALATTSASVFSSKSLGFSCLLPEGNLISVQGTVAAIHNMNGSPASGHLSCERVGDVLQTIFFQGNRSSSCIHVLMNNEMVRIFGYLSEHEYPVGFGPGVNATFHRVLKLRGTNKLKLTPVSFIVLNSIRIANEPSVEKSSEVLSGLHLPSATSLNNVSSGMISELIQCTDCKPMQVTCRIVAVRILVLEKSRKYGYLCSEVQSKQQIVDIPIMGFVLDDGSSVCCCWTNAERAATLLRLHEELPAGAFESSGCTLKWVGIEKRYWKSTMFHIERILRGCERITMRNYGSIIDSSCQDLTVSVNSDDSLSISDENLLKFIVLNACFGTFWTVVASVMDSNAVKELEKDHHIPMEMTALPMQNIWATEVRYLNTLTEARKMVQELLDR